MTVGVALRLLAVMGLWASCFPLITIGLGLAPHLAFAAMRTALAGLCLLLVGALFRRPLPRGTRVWRLLVVVALGDTTLGFLGMFHAAEFVSPGLATVIYNAQPLLAAVLARIFLGERLKMVGKTGLIAGFTGIIAIALGRRVQCPAERKEGANRVVGARRRLAPPAEAQSNEKYSMAPANNSDLSS